MLYENEGVLAMTEPTEDYEEKIKKSVICELSDDNKQLRKRVFELENILEWIGDLTKGNVHFGLLKKIKESSP